MRKKRIDSIVSNTIIVRPGPQEYICQEGILDHLPELLSKRGVNRLLLVHGTVSWEKAKSYLTTLFDSQIEIEFTAFNGECTYKEVARIQDIAESFQANIILGVGGGKIMDTVKYVANNVSNAYAVLIPTLASNCAPWTPLSVMYTSEGEFIGYDFFTQQVGLLLLEPRLIFDSPIEYFIGGIADTLAKWYESDALLSLPGNRSAPLLIARAAAKSCKEIIEKEAIQAVQDAKNEKLTNAYIKVTETIILTSGLVGGFGDKLARTTGAHSIHDGLTIFPEVHPFLHGEKVAYGVLVQLVLDGKLEEISKIITLFKSLNLPTSLEDLGIRRSTEIYEKLAASSLEHDPGILNLPYSVTIKTVSEAIQTVEEIAQQA